MDNLVRAHNSYTYSAVHVACHLLQRTVSLDGIADTLCTVRHAPELCTRDTED